MPLVLRRPLAQSATPRRPRSSDLLRRHASAVSCLDDPQPPRELARHRPVRRTGGRPAQRRDRQTNAVSTSSSKDQNQAMAITARSSQNHESVFEQVIAALPLSVVFREMLGDGALKPGSDPESFKVVCPFHDDKNPSLHLSDAKKVWHCFGCGASGNLFSLEKRRYDLETVPQAVKSLASRFSNVCVLAVEMKGPMTKVAAATTRLTILLSPQCIVPLPSQPLANGAAGWLQDAALQACWLAPTHTMSQTSNSQRGHRPILNRAVYHRIQSKSLALVSLPTCRLCLDAFMHSPRLAMMRRRA
jgi:hypothetical protein